MIWFGGHAIPLGCSGVNRLSSLDAHTMVRRPPLYGGPHRATHFTAPPLYVSTGRLSLSTGSSAKQQHTVLSSDTMALFSDAHSLPKLGRELTVFPGRPSYDGLSEALKAQNIAYTVEFFPQEGKYHY